MGALYTGEFIRRTPSSNDPSALIIHNEAPASDTTQNNSAAEATNWRANHYKIALHDELFQAVKAGADPGCASVVVTQQAECCMGQWLMNSLVAVTR